MPKASGDGAAGPPAGRRELHWHDRVEGSHDHGAFRVRCSRNHPDAGPAPGTSGSVTSSANIGVYSSGGLLGSTCSMGRRSSLGVVSREETTMETTEDGGRRRDTTMIAS